MTLASDKHVASLRRRLREHRLKHNLSYEALAARIHATVGVDRITLATVRRFIEGATEPHESTVYAIEQYLKRAEGK